MGLAVPPAGRHSYRFSYDVAGNAAWVAGGTTLFCVVGFAPPAAVVVSLENTSGAIFIVYTVLMTSP